MTDDQWLWLLLWLHDERVTYAEFLAIVYEEWLDVCICKDHARIVAGMA